ncbi:MAG: LysM peptidoglycan-binding domain-containing protein [Roseovarius sp.]
MSKWAGLASGPVIGAGAVVAVVAGFGLYQSGVFAPETAPVGSAPAALVEQQVSQVVEAPQTAEAEVETAALTPDPVEQATPETQPETQPEAEPVTDADPLPAAPSIDTFRLDPDGSMLLAGQAHPDWTTTVMLDGAALDTVNPDGSGKFVSFLSVEPSDQPRILSLVMRDAGAAREVTSLDEIIIAPHPAQTDDTVTQPEAAAANDPAAPEQTAPSQTAQDETAPAETAQDDTAQAEVAQTDAEPTDVDQNTGAQTVLLANEEGVQVIQPAIPVDVAPEVMSTVALDAISYSEQGEVQLSGRGQGEGFVRVYLDNAPVTTLPIAQDGNWRGDLPQVDTGVYTLRIDETDAEGNVTSRVETPFKREDETLISAANDAVENQRISAITVQPGSTLWAISRERYGEGTLYVRVFEANRERIRNPDLIYPGQVFTLPE